MKGGEENFRGILLTKFATKTKRDEVVSALRKHFDATISEVWVKPDLPVRIRAANGFLLGLKRLMVSDEWKFEKSNVRVDVDVKCLEVGGMEVVKVVDDLQLSWHPEWSAWKEFMEDADVVDLMKKFHELAGRSAGKGKGRKG